MAQEKVTSPIESEVIDLLFRYYQILKQDLLLQTGSVKNHVRNSQIVGAALISILTFLLSNKDYWLSQHNVWLWLGVAVSFATVTFYLIYDVLEAMFAVAALEECLSFLEERVNAILGANKLIWQSGVANKLWPTSPPVWGLAIYEAVLVAGTTIVLPAVVYYNAWFLCEHNSTLQLVLVVSACYSVGSVSAIFLVLRGLNRRVRKKVRDMIDNNWGHESISFPKKTGRAAEAS